MTAEERDRYHNRILLCPNHHTEVDKSIADFPVELLHQLKTDHELWVQNTLGTGPTPQKQAADLAYAMIVDAAVEACSLRTWKQWTSWALAAIPQWTEEQPDLAAKFAERVLGAVLPGHYPDLERATATLARAVHHAASFFLRHAELDDHRRIWRAIEFYKQLTDWDPEARQRLEDQWDEWVEECHILIIQATKAANWFAEEVRRSLNPFFFLEEGKFLISQGPLLDLSFTTELHQFTPEEKVAMPQALIERVRARDRARRPVA